jgi:hypothetical protein
MQTAQNRGDRRQKSRHQATTEQRLFPDTSVVGQAQRERAGQRATLFESSLTILPRSPSGRLWFHSKAKRSAVRKRSSSDNLAKMLAHHSCGPEPRLCGDRLDGVLRGFEQALRTPDTRAGDPLRRRGANLRTEASAQRSGAHGRMPSDDRKREISTEILFHPHEELAN